MIQNECNVVIIEKEPQEFICLLEDIITFDLFKNFVRSKISTKNFSMTLFGTDLILNETIYQNEFLNKQTYNIAIQIIPKNEIVNDDSLLKVLENSNLQSASIIPDNNNKVLEIKAHFQILKGLNLCIEILRKIQIKYKVLLVRFIAIYVKDKLNLKNI